MTDESATLADEIKKLQKEVKVLDKAVAEATEQRKEEHGEYLTFQTENSAAVQLIEAAKNRLSPAMNFSFTSFARGWRAFNLSLQQ